MPRVAGQAGHGADGRRRAELERREALAFAVDQAWRTLENIDRSIDRADAKAAAALTAAGAIGVALFTLGGHGGLNAWAIGALALSIALTFTAAVQAGLTLRPRRYRGGASATLVYHDDIARLPDPTVEGYVARASALFVDPAALSQELNGQIWATGRVAAAKYVWVNRSMLSLVGALLATGLTALLVNT
jgi:hypothetical protein